MKPRCNSEKSNTAQWVNGQPQPLNLQLQSAMFYPNAYLNFNHNGEYTKHYYNGAERIASRLGDNQQTIEAEANDRLQSRIAQIDELFKAQISEMAPYEEPAVNVPGRSSGEGTRNLLFPSVGYDPIPAFTDLQPTGTPDDIFYYHINHLGSTAYVTDNNATITQGILYAPFGEITTEYAPLWQNGTLPKYAFNAKELDEETGMYYYEARYYKPPVFTSRDPMMDQKPWLTPYHYCSNNPVGRVDPSGCEDWIPPTDGSGNWTAERGDGYWKLAKQAGIPLEEARAAVITANKKRGQKRTTETMVYPGDVVNIGGSNTETNSETNRPSISGYPLIPASGRIESVSLIGTLCDEIIGGLLQEGLISLGMDEENAFQLSSGIVFFGSILISKKAPECKMRYPGNNPAKAPKGFYWNGKTGSIPGSKNGNWYNPKTKETLRPDLNYPYPIGPHWDYKNTSGEWFRIFPDNSIKPK